MHTTAEVYSFTYRLKSIHLYIFDKSHAFSFAQVLEQVHQHFHRCILLLTGFRKIYENIQGWCAATGL